MSYYEDLCKKVCEIVEKVGEFALKNWDIEFDYEIKSPHNYVTKIDKECENMLIENLSKILPTANFLAEETLSNSYIEGLTWIIDPLDGTVNFSHKLPIFCISICIIEENEPVEGIVYNPIMKYTYYAKKGSGAYKNNKKILVSKIKNLYNSLLITGFPYYTYTNPKNVFKLFNRFATTAQAVRRLGSAALDLCMVAEGIFEGFWEENLQVWDVAAGSLIVKEAGGKVTDYFGKNNYLFGKTIVATNGKIHKQMLDIISEIVKR